MRADPVAVTSGNLHSRLATSEFQWLALEDPSNIAYATGYRSIAGDLFAGHRMLALLSADATFLAAPAADAAAATERAIGVESYEPFGSFFFESSSSPLREIAGRHASLHEAVDAVARRAGASGRIGADSQVRTDTIAVLEGRGTVVPAHEWLGGMRRRKLAEEVETLKSAARLAEDAIDAAIEGAGPGATEKEVAAVVAATMAAGGGIPRFLVVTSGERSALADARASDRPLRRGDLVRFDVGCTLDGYWSDVGRTAVVGQPSKAQAARYRALLAGEEAQLHAAAPGVKASELFRVAVEAVEAGGVVPYRRHHCGHGIGLDVYERPIVAPGDETVLEAGTVLCFETPLYDLDHGGLMVEDAVVITDAGCTMMTRSDRSLRVIAA